MSQGCALLILGSKGQRSRSWRMVIWKWSTEIMVADLNLLGSVGDLYCFSNTFSMLLYVAPICCPSCFSRGPGGPWILTPILLPDDNWLCNQPMIMKLHTLAPHESRMCPIDFGVKRSKVKVMAHGYLKMVHRNNGCRFEFVGVGGGLCNASAILSMIMKLHTLTHHESRMRPIDFEVKRSKVKVMAHGY